MLLREKHRRLCRVHFPTFATEALRAQGLVPARHHRFLCEKLQAVAEGRCRRLMVLMPPGSAKSTYCSKLFPAFLMGRGRVDIIGASNTQALAEDFSLEVQGFVRDNGEILETGLLTEAAARWRTTSGGAYRAAGVGGTITGRRADAGIIDDPLKSREDADSELTRERQWKWLLADLRTRLKPGAAIVLVLTHWHEDDIAGRAMLRQPGMWEVVRIPAVAEAPDPESQDPFVRLPDPLGRQPGEWLWDDDSYGYGESLREVFDEYELSGASRDWAALYQQRPAPAEGVLFKVRFLTPVPAVPFGVRRRVRAWDLAATKQIGTNNPDWTVGVKMLEMNDGSYLVEDVIRFREPPEVVRALIHATALNDTPVTQIGLPEDPGQASKDQILTLTTMLAGFSVISSPESGDKATRAEPYISQVNVGNVKYLVGDWNQTYINELASFGSGGKDDQVDASSRAFMMLAGQPSLRIDAETLRRAKARVPGLGVRR